MKFAYYPGCSAESTARDQDMSVREVARALDIELVELKGWTCCGSTPAHHTDKQLSVALPAANLLLARKAGLDMVVSCAACYNRMKVANHEIRTDTKTRHDVSALLKEEYDGSVKVRHIIEILLDEIGTKKLRKAMKQSLGGLKVASYYGCLLVRPHGVTEFDDPENPTTIDTLVATMGGESIDWPHKVECCGGGMTLSRTDVVVELTGRIVRMAKSAGAQCIAVACPMCQVNLDMRQGERHRVEGNDFNVPVVYITQLLGLCLGISPRKLGMNKCIVSPKAVLESVNSIY